MAKIAKVAAKTGTIAASPSKRAGGKKYVILSGKVDVTRVPQASKLRAAGPK
ncbi:hypothetical protein [Mycobacterium sp. 236(2023)]|uniref:hypothetical protein n=1 Tax=Mycobacterium sp. 236(2023) TaxID=3038163 RepID=UPI0024152F76|nr:hypothetical protein [Mycobacterium sp. 236(2023)]MDG4669371.1 hypothetical protein [Mycobacterium sp. 236(2023)]